MNTRFTQRNLTLVALGLTVLLLLSLVLLGAAGYLEVYRDPGRPNRLYGIGAGALLACVLLYLVWRGNAYAAKIAVLAIALMLPLIFKREIFDLVVPQAIWIPFIMALVVTSFRWAMLVALTTMIVIVVGYPNAFGNPVQIFASLIIFFLLVAGRLAQREMLVETLEAKRRAERSEASLRENEMKYRMLSEQSPLAIQVFAPDGRTLRVNQAWEKLWGIPFAALAGYQVFEDEQLVAAGVLPILQRAFAGERVEVPLIEYDKARSPVVPGASGTCWIRVFAYPLQGPEGQVREVVMIQEDVSERIMAEERIRSLAYYDPLTRLPNRRLFADRLAQALASSKRSQEFGALLILDLDHFKALNDTQGHDVGDRLLIEVAGRLVATVRAKDTVSRFGGDEFVLILEEMGRHEAEAVAHAEQVAEKILDVIRQPFELSGRLGHYQSSTSIGLTLFVGQEVSLESLLKQADVALYQAKGGGRNQISFFSQEMQAAIEERMALDAALRSGLANGEFELFYQPQFDCRVGVTGAEALLRWHSAQYGAVSPARFIPLAEESGLILPIGRWVLQAACLQLKAWSAQPLMQGLQVSVNVSARQFMQADFVDQVAQCLRDSGIDPKRLKLELTESIVLDDVEGVIGKMQALNELGVAFALDDFGTGYSSLSYLKRLPLEQLKVDQSFVCEIDTDPNAAAIVRAILAMSQSLGIQAIAEGVETVTQQNFLFENGCTVYQGYLFGRPMPAEALEHLLRSGPLSAAGSAQ